MLAEPTAQSGRSSHGLEQQPLSRPRTPEQVMDDVSIPFEKAVESLEDVKAVYSTSSSNVAQVQVEYEYGVDMDEKKRQLESALDNVALPEGAQEPTIMAIRRK